MSVEDEYTITYEYCDAGALPAEETSISSLEYNKFYKLCPGLHTADDGTYAPLGQPRCGDGSNYAFLVTRPSKETKGQNVTDAGGGGGGEKILIELQGGGACWDAITCTFQQFFLSFPPWNNELVGRSCSELGDLICSKNLGGEDLSEYTTIFIPYCTQDIHMGDSEGTEYGVKHVGAHNLHRTLQWMFKNFPNPASVFITGCSAGATPLPVVYDLINTHYAKSSFPGGEGKAVNIDVISDSSVFLTPTSFLENYMGNWNVGTIMDRIDFDFEQYKYTESFPYLVLDHALQRSKKTDNIGYVTTDADQVSLYYYKLMNAGSRSDLFGRRMRSMERELYNWNYGLKTLDNIRRRMNEDGTETEWWDKMSSSIDLAEKAHSNFDAFVVEGTGHCNFGLNTPLQYDGFEEWASNILQVHGASSSAPSSNSSISVGLPSGSGSVITGTGSVPLFDQGKVDTGGDGVGSIPPVGEPAIETSNLAFQQASSSFATTAILLLLLRFLFFSPRS